MLISIRITSAGRLSPLEPSRVSLQPILILEQRAKGDGDLPMLIALIAWRRCPRIAQHSAPQLRKFI